MPELWQTAELMEVQFNDQAAPPDGFWLQRFFPRTFVSTAETIYFDQIAPRDRRLAPFVAPNVQGRVMRSQGRTVASFQPAYLKPKHKVDPSKAIMRRPNEPLGGINTGSLSLDARYDAAVADNLRVERELIERRWDWMACMAIRDGAVTVVGEDYPSTTVDFGRHASLTVTLSGGTLWTAAGTSFPLVDIGAARNNAFTRGRAPVNTLIFGVNAWNAFENHATVTPLLDNMRRGSESNFNTTGLTDGSPVEYVGQISGPNGAGRLDLWKYSNDYVTLDDFGNETSIPYIHPGDVIGVGGAIGGVRAFGAIMDKKANLQPLPIFPKMWEEEDPSATWTMSQSAPLMVPTNPNNTFRIRATA